MKSEQALSALKAELSRTAVDGRVALSERKIAELKSAFRDDQVVQADDQVPSFELPDANGGFISGQLVPIS